jgi:hypothetical protein
MQYFFCRFRLERASLVSVKPIEILKSSTVNNLYSHDKKTERGKASRQIIASLIANIGTINTGMIFGYSAVAIPQLLEPDSKVSVNEDQASWIGNYSSFFKES